MFKPLRDKILELAIKGKLVPQLDSESAVEQIGPAPAKDEVPFVLPEKWKWVQAKCIGSWKSGATPRRDNAEFWENGTVPWLKTGEVSNGLVLATEEFVTEKAVKQARLRLNPKGSVLIAMYGTGTVGNIGVLGIPCTTNQACCACITDSNVVINWFLFYVLLAFRAFLIGKASGTTNLQNLSKDKIEKIWIPLPPLEEQRRIVAKLDDIMGNLERMDQAYTELSGPMAKHFKNLVLQQAISGQLVPQLDSEPAVEQIGLAPAKEEEPFALPEKWKWVQLENLCLYLQRGKSPKYSEIKKYPVVAQKCNQWDGLHLELALFFDPNTLASYKAERFLQQDDVLLNSTGTGTLGRVGSYDVAVNPYELAVADGHVTVIRANSSCLMPTYVKFVLSSAVFQMIITEAGTGTTKQQELALSKVKQLWIPLPPVEEQRRIVARIEELFGDVDKLLEWQQFA